MADKTEIRRFAENLLLVGGANQIVASDGTAKDLARHTRMTGRKKPDGTDEEVRIIPEGVLMRVQDITGVPPMLDHRVVTLHHKIHAGVLARRDQREELEATGGRWIDVVCVDLYPLAPRVAEAKQKFISGELTAEAAGKSVMEKMDVGGPTLIRGGAKTAVEGRYVLTSLDHRRRFLDHLRCGSPRDLSFRMDLAEEAIAYAQRYDDEWLAFLRSLNQAGAFV